MSDTRDKLGESAFFLERLKEAETQHPAFTYYLSAFVGAARSVFWVMRHEYKRVVGWNVWYDSISAGPELQRMLEGLNRMRIQSVKRGPVRTVGRMTFKVVDGITPDELRDKTNHLAGKQLRVTFYDGDEITEEPDGIAGESRALSFRGYVEEVFRVLDEFPDERALDICRAYYDFLASVVDECEARFSL